MKFVSLSLEKYSYPVIIDDSYDEFFDAYYKYCNSKNILVIIDINVLNEFNIMLSEIENKGIKVNKFIINQGENSKNLRTINEIYGFCLKYCLDKNSCIIGIGGGVVGDIAGYVASTFMRGINLIHIPTTLLAQVDSSIGGKNGVDIEGYKNMIGTIYQPKFVYSNVSILSSLPKRQLLSGIAEIIKCGMIYDKKFFNYLESNAYNILLSKNDALFNIIYQSAKIKAAIVEKDELDNDLRMILNFGHTIGHAIESASNFSLSHGECVGLGMIAETKISLKLNLCNQEVYNQVAEIINKFGLPHDNIKFNDVTKFLKMDKKIIKEYINFVAIKDIGEVEIIKLNYKELINILKNL